MVTHTFKLILTLRLFQRWCHVQGHTYELLALKQGLHVAVTLRSDRSEHDTCERNWHSTRQDQLLLMEPAFSAPKQKRAPDGAIENELTVSGCDHLLFQAWLNVSWQ